MKKVYLLVFILIAFGTQANASFETRVVSKIILHDAGSILIELKGGIITSENCTNALLILKPSSQHYKEMYAAILSAYHSGSKISGWVNTCDTRFNYPVLTRLDLLEK